MIKLLKKPATKFGQEFSIGANVTPTVYTMNTAPTDGGPIKPKDFDGASPEPWTSDANIANPPVNRTADFNNPMGQETIPLTSSLTGTA